MSRLMSLMTALTMSAGLWAIEPARTILLYPGGAPDSNGYIADDEFVKEGTKFFKTSEPRIDLYLPSDKDAKKSAFTAFPVLLVCPGGGYEYTSTGNEGIDVANFFVPRGYAIAVLKYRMPNAHENIPLEDAIQAMHLLRENAIEWNLQTEKIGVMGFSAGGHLAASLLTKFADATSRPDYGILIYPVISMTEDLTHQGSCRRLLGEKPTLKQRQNWSTEQQVTPNTPPCLIVACQDDKTVKVKNSLLFYEALTDNKVPSSLVIVPVGGHGWGFRRHFPDRERIDEAILTFMREHSR